MLSVSDAIYIKDCKFWIEFNNGDQGILDLQGELTGDFKTLTQGNNITAYGLDGYTISWQSPDHELNLEFAPEFLHDKTMLLEKRQCA